MSMGYQHGGKGLNKEAGPLFLVPTFPMPPKGYRLGVEQPGIVAYLICRKTGSIYLLLARHRIQGAPASSTVTQGAASHE